jgi:YfiH family protein
MAMTAAGAGYIPFAFPSIPHIRCAFTTRFAGNLSLYGREGAEREEALAARAAVFETLDLDSWSELAQVHGDVFIKDHEPTPVDREPTVEADGHATSRKRHALCIKTADCQGILLAHPAGHVAAIHVGWRGNVLRFIRTAVTAFCLDRALDPADVRAVRGPSLGYAEFVNFSREWPAVFAPWYDPATRRVDLWSLTRRQLGEAGLKSRNIFSVDMCTYSLNSLFFSHRRKDAGRQMALVWME